MTEKKKFKTITTHVTDAMLLGIAGEQGEKKLAYNKLRAEVDAKELALADFKESTKAEVKILEDRLATIDVELARLAAAAVTRKLDRDIEVVEIPDDARGMMLIARADDPQQKPIEVRAMNAGELADRERRAQGDLFGRRAAPAPIAADDDGVVDDGDAADRDTDVPPPPLEEEHEPEAVELNGQPLVNARTARRRTTTPETP